MQRSTMPYLALAAAEVLLALTAMSIVPANTSALIPHPPIFIGSDSDFTPGNGVVGGSGTPSDPYVIEGWEIDASSALGIGIENTLAPFIIRDVFVHSGGSNNGISLTVVENGRIENATLSGNAEGILLMQSTNITVAGSVFVSDALRLSGSSPDHYASHTITPDNSVDGMPLLYYKNCMGLDVDRVAAGQVLLANCTSVRVSRLNMTTRDGGIRLYYVNGATVEANNVTGWGIRTDYSSNVAIQRNRVATGGIGIYTFRGTDNAIEDNVVSDNLWGIYLYQSTRSRITQNRVSSNDEGIRLLASDQVIIRNNDASSNAGFGIRSFSSISLQVYHNNLLNNSFQQAQDDRSVENQWNDSYPSGGNHWSDYTGIDNCSGPLQNVCPDPDGIGDTPYVLDADSQDNYPLMAPPDLLPPSAPVLTDATLAGPAAADLTLQWNASPDEGTANGTVAYRVLRATDWTGPYAEIASLPANGSPFHQYTCPGCGHSLVDTISYFFRVQAVDAANNTADSNLGAKYAKPVAAGKDLLTVPVQVSDSTLTTVLQTVWPDLAGTWTYESSDAMDPWKAHGAVKGGGDLTQLPFGTAFWLDTAAAGVYTVAGLVVDNPVAQLQPGWNLVAYASVVPETRDVSLAGVSGVTRFQTFDALPPYRLRSVPADESLVWGEAYWTYTTVGGLWPQG